MKHDIHEISNELYTQKQKAQMEKQIKENTKKLKLNAMLILKEEIENYILDLGIDDINDIQLNVLDNKDIIIDNASSIIVNKKYCGDNKEQIRKYLNDNFLSQFKIYFKEYKEKENIQKKIYEEDKKKKEEEIYNRIYDYLNNLYKQVEKQGYDMKQVLENMKNDEVIDDTFIQLDLLDDLDNRKIYHKVVSDLKSYKNVNYNKIVKKNKIPLGWKCYGFLKVIDKMLK